MTGIMLAPILKPPINLKNFCSVSLSGSVSVTVARGEAKSGVGVKAVK